MNRKKKQEAKEKASTRQLMGIEGITGHSLATPHGELVFFMIKPTNISVLSDSSIGARIYALMMYCQISRHKSRKLLEKNNRPWL